MKHTRMKNRCFFYGILAIVAVVGILACFIGYTTGTLPTITPKQQTTAVAPTPAVAKKNKNCRCCTERSTKYQEEMEAYIKRKREAAQKGTSE